MHNSTHRKHGIRISEYLLRIKGPKNKSCVPLDAHRPCRCRRWSRSRMRALPSSFQPSTASTSPKTTIFHTLFTRRNTSHPWNYDFWRHGTQKPVPEKLARPPKDLLLQQERPILWFHELFAPPGEVPGEDVSDERTPFPVVEVHS